MKTWRSGVQKEKIMSWIFPFKNPTYPNLFENQTVTLSSGLSGGAERDWIRTKLCKDGSLIRTQGRKEQVLIDQSPESLRFHLFAILSLAIFTLSFTSPHLFVVPDQKGKEKHHLFMCQVKTGTMIYMNPFIKIM